MRSWTTWTDEQLEAAVRAEGSAGEHPEDVGLVMQQFRDVEAKLHELFGTGTAP